MPTGTMEIMNEFYTAHDKCEVKVVIIDKTGKEFIAEHHKINKGEQFKMNLQKKEVSESE